MMPALACSCGNTCWDPQPAIQHWRAGHRLSFVVRPVTEPAVQALRATLVNALLPHVQVQYIPPDKWEERTQAIKGRYDFWERASQKTGFVSWD